MEIRNFILKQTFQCCFFLKALKCSSCTDDEPATSWCVECAEYICDSCVQAHQRLKITKEHTIKPKDEATENDSAITDEKTLMCHVHLQVRSKIEYSMKNGSNKMSLK